MDWDWDKLRVFHAVAEAGSFTRAGDLLGLSQSAVSRQIGALEESLKIPLFHRHARGLMLTEQGEFLYRTAHEIFAKLAMAEAQLLENKERPKGALRVTATVALGSSWLTPRMGEFLELYPDITLDLILDDKELDLAMREADIALRMLPPRQPGLVQRHLMTLQVSAYASGAYIKRYGMPKSAEDLDRHKIITFGDHNFIPNLDPDWLLKAGGGSGHIRVPTLIVNDIYAMLRGVQAGIGIAALPDFVAQSANNAIQILPDLEGPRITVFFVYPEELRHSKRIQVFRDFLLRKVASPSY